MDPALDRDADAYDPDAYMRTGEADHMPVKDGHVAAVFRIQPLRGDARLCIERMAQRDDAAGFGQMLEACRLGLVDVVAVYDDGQNLHFAAYRKLDRQRGCVTITSEGMALLHSAGATEESPDGSWQLAVELGGRVLKETYGDPL